MGAHKIEKLEQRLYRTIKDIREATTPREVTNYIRRFGMLEHHYTKLTGTRFNPVPDHEELQDVEWKY